MKLIWVFILLCSSLASAGDLIYKNGFEIEPDCSVLTYPPNLSTRQFTYSTFNDGYNFGESTNASFLLNLIINEYVTLSDFSYPQLDSRRRLVFSPAPTNYNLMSQGTVSISECPGDFNPTAACVIQVNNNSTIIVTTKPSDPTTAPFCKIDPSKIYYINYILSPDPFNTSPACNNTSHFDCAMFNSEAL